MTDVIRERPNKIEQGCYDGLKKVRVSSLVELLTLDRSSAQSFGAEPVGP